MNQTDDEQWLKRFLAPLAGDYERRAAEAECIGPARFWQVACGTDAWAEAERAHLAGCGRCRERARTSLEAIEAKGRPNDLKAAVSAAYPGQASPDQGSMLDEFTQVPLLPDALLPKNNWPVSEPAGIVGTANDSLMAAAGFLDENPNAAEPGGVFAMRAAAPTAPHGVNCWLIGFADDAAAVRRRIAEHAFGDPEHRFEIRIYRLPVPGRTDLVQAQLEIEPVPTKNDLELVVEFRVGGKRQFRFEVPPELRRDPTAEPRPRTRTAPSEPLPAAAFNLQGNSEWRDEAWPATLILRSSGLMPATDWFTQLIGGVVAHCRPAALDCITNMISCHARSHMLM